MMLNIKGIMLSHRCGIFVFKTNMYVTSAILQSRRVKVLTVLQQFLYITVSKARYSIPAII